MEQQSSYWVLKRIPFGFGYPRGVGQSVEYCYPDQQSGFLACLPHLPDPSNESRDVKVALHQMVEVALHQILEFEGC